MKVLISILMVIGATTAFAGIKDKNAVKAVNKTVKEELSTVKKACGNKKISAKADLKKWNTYKYKTKDLKLKYLGHLNSLVKEVYGFMAKICKDKDFKEEIAKVTSISFSGKDKISQYDQAAFTLKGTSLSVKLNADGVGSWKNEYSLKKVWE